LSAPGEIRLGAAVRGQILAHARAALPNEACGLLAGSTATGLARAFHPARNADASPYRYSLDPEDLVRITFAMERAGDELLAIVHSHPRTGAEPSATDRRAAQLYPGTPQLIVSLAAGETAALRAWHIGPEVVEELALRVSQPPGSTSVTSPVARSTTTSSRGEPSSPPER
jgi:proteasome lid subunit RPN8/RPN11